MAKLLLNADGKVLTSNDKVYKAPESTLKKLLDATKSCICLFSRYTGTSVDNLISYDDTENVKTLKYMFEYSSNLVSIPLLNTSNVTDMSNMFYNCYKLQTIDITSMDKITSTSSSSYFANNCSSLTKFIIRTMTVIPPLNNNSFNNCYHFTGTINSAYNPEGLKDGRIYVPDNMVETLKSATNWSEFADIIVPLSTLVEE